MTKSDSVRQYAYENYIKPARKGGYKAVSIKAGDIATALGLSGRLPLVCGALGTNKFRDEYSLKLRSRKGPGQSTTTTFIFDL